LQRLLAVPKSVLSRTNLEILHLRHLLLHGIVVCRRLAHARRVHVNVKVKVVLLSSIPSRHAQQPSGADDCAVCKGTGGSRWSRGPAVVYRTRCALGEGVPYLSCFS